MRDVCLLDDDFQHIVLDIPTISLQEKVDCYTYGLKPYSGNNYTLASTHASTILCVIQNESSQLIVVKERHQGIVYVTIKVK